MNEEIFYYLGFSYFLGIGPIRFFSLLKHFQKAKKAYLAKKEELLPLLGEKITEKFLDFRKNFNPEKIFFQLKKREIEVLPYFSEDYPLSLKSISDPPICLYVKGDKKILSQKKNFYLAIVGTRKPTSYGIEVAKKFSFQMAKEKVIIVSGMAIGIDTVAHWAALRGQGKTIAVLGCGVDIVYPAINRGLYEKIIKEGGAVISEFPPGQMVAKGLFIARNRIISGLSSGVLVVEGLKDSGALITASYAASQGKDVFAPPAPINFAQSQAPNILLKQGAKLVTDIGDIFEEWGIKISPRKKEDIKKNLNPQEIEIVDALQEKSLSVDEIALILGKQINEILNLVSLLEIKKVIEKNGEGKYEIVG
jgi:DNA processing protein